MAAQRLRVAAKIIGQIGQDLGHAQQLVGQREVQRIDLLAILLL